MTGTLTYTGVIGPALALTTTVFSDVVGLDYQLDKEVLKVSYGLLATKIAYLDIRASATATFTFVAGVSLAVTQSS